jgi:hypothetical protein
MDYHTDNATNGCAKVEAEIVAQADQRFDFARLNILTTVKEQLENGAYQMQTAGPAKVTVKAITAFPILEFTTRTSKLQAVDGLELTFQNAASAQSLIFALQFFFYRKTTIRIGSAGTLKTGVFARLQLRDANDRQIAGCSALLKRKIRRDRKYEYVLTDDVPALCEFGFGESVNQINLVREFVLDAVSAFPELISKIKNQHQFKIIRLLGGLPLLSSPRSKALNE